MLHLLLPLICIVIDAAVGLFVIVIDFIVILNMMIANPIRQVLESKG